MIEQLILVERGEGERDLKGLAGTWFDKQHLRLTVIDAAGVNNELPPKPVVAEWTNPSSELRERVGDQRESPGPVSPS